MDIIWNDRFLVSATVLSFLLGILLAILTGCAPQRTIPKGVPYPLKVRPGMKVYPMEQVRCLGGGIGGCGSILAH